VRQDRALSEQEPAVRLEHGPRRILDPGVRREAAAQLAPIEHLVRDVVQLGRLERPAEHRSVLGTALDRARDDEEPLAGIGLEVAPELVRPPEERHVRRMLVVRQPDDPRQPVRGAELMQQVELLQSKHALAATRQVIGRCGPHPAQADDDDVVPIRHGRSLRPRAGDRDRPGDHGDRRADGTGAESYSAVAPASTETNVITSEPA
jgi:hypothetical protein